MIPEGIWQCQTGSFELKTCPSLTAGELLVQDLSGRGKRAQISPPAWSHNHRIPSRNGTASPQSTLSFLFQPQHELRAQSFPQSFGISATACDKHRFYLVNNPMQFGGVSAVQIPYKFNFSSWKLLSPRAKASLTFPWLHAGHFISLQESIH